MEQLLQKLTAAGLADDSGNIILEKYELGVYQSVDAATFQQFFGTTDYSYSQLVTADEGKGYKRFFDSWKAQGILK